MTQDVIHAILTALPKISAEDLRLDKKHGIDRELGVRFYDPNSVQRMFDENVYEKDLENTLLTFDDEPLQKTEALLDYGRDHEPPPYHELLECFQARPQRKLEIVQTILEKLPAFETYLAAALQKLQKEGLSIETI